MNDFGVLILGIIVGGLMVLGLEMVFVFYATSFEFGGKTFVMTQD